MSGKKELTDRDELLQIARNMVGESGYEKFNMAAFAREAKVARRTLYNYFSGKDDVMECLANFEAEMFLAILKEEVPYKNSFKDYLVDCLYYTLVNQRLNPYFETLSSKSVYMANLYFNSDRVKLLWSGLMEEKYEKALKNEEINNDFDLERVMTWFGRVVVSYAVFFDPSESESETKQYIKDFFVSAL